MAASCQSPCHHCSSEKTATIPLTEAQATRSHDTRLSHIAEMTLERAVKDMVGTGEATRNDGANVRTSADAREPDDHRKSVRFRLRICCEMLTEVYARSEDSASVMAGLALPSQCEEAARSWHDRGGNRKAERVLC